MSDPEAGSSHPYGTCISMGALRRDAESLSSEEFLRQLVYDARRREGPAAVERPTGRLTDDETREWTAEFGLDDASDLLVTPALPRHLRGAEPATPTDPSSPGQAHRVDRSATPSAEPEDRPSLVDVVPADVLAEAERLLEAEAKRRLDEWPPESP